MKRLILAALVAALLPFLAASAAGQDYSRFLVQPDECATLAPDRNDWWQDCAGRVADPNLPIHVSPGYFLAGRTDAWEGAPDLFLSSETRYWGRQGPMGADGTPKLYVRSLVLSDLGDTPDIQLRAAGPDRGDYRGPAEAFQYKGVPTGVAKIYSQVYAPDCYGGLSYTAGCGQFGRTALIDFGIDGEPTATSRPGYIGFYTAPEGKADEELRMRIEKTGQFTFYRNGSNASPTIRFADAELTGISRAGKNGVGFTVSGEGGLTVQIPDHVGSTSMLLLIRPDSGTIVEREVTIGPPDSCGAGYRCLKVAN